MKWNENPTTRQSGRINPQNIVVIQIVKADQVQLLGSHSYVNELLNYRAVNVNIKEFPLWTDLSLHTTYAFIPYSFLL